MKEINDKDLEQASGGIKFSVPGFSDDESEGGTATPNAGVNKVDPGGSCPLFERAQYASGQNNVCKQCRHVKTSIDNQSYYCTANKI